ncbi:hypothetical protein [Vibrio sp. 10N.239.312.D08]|uniref:hypothetical protein n=1 Tax=Vibrio sp. 10N.239.312.D08 TaxID=3229978 RepID=UPI00354BB4B8
MDTINENWSPFGNDDVKTHIMQAQAGKGRSLVNERLKEASRNNGGLYVNVESKGRGLLPYEYELARRYQSNAQGPLPRELRKKEGNS